ncbi:MAG: hypothetical protein QMD46_13740 [Methanomicrobiales archaeon]|nr:hypothetical protein [Methanomicrobiales archaeon]
MIGRYDIFRKTAAHAVVKGSIPICFLILFFLLPISILSAGCTSQPSSAVPSPNVTLHNNSQENGSPYDLQSLNVTEGIYSINVSFPAVPDKITVYVFERPDYTTEWVRSLAKKLGMSGEIRESNEAYYANETEEDDFYFVVQKDDKIIAFKNYHQQSGVPFSAEKATESVHGFLECTGLMFPDATEANIGYNIGESISPSGEPVQTWKQTVVTFSRELDGLTVLGSEIIADVDSRGNIVGLYLHWQDYKPYKEVSVKSPEQAFAEYLNYQKESLYIEGTPMKPEKVVVTNVLLLYRSTGNYLEPTYVFQGYGQQGELTQPFAPVYIAATNDIADDPDCN